MVNDRPRVVIVGGGFGGLAAAKRLRSVPVEVTLLDRRNYHLFQPLLYQVATGVLSPANIASPLRGILRHHRNCRVLMGQVVDFDLAGQRVMMREGDPIAYDWLIVAAGATHGYFGHDEWEKYAPGLKTIDDATEIRKRILFAFEAAEQESDPARRSAWLTFVNRGRWPDGRGDGRGTIGHCALTLCGMTFVASALPKRASCSWKPANIRWMSFRANCRVNLWRLSKSCMSKFLR